MPRTILPVAAAAALVALALAGASGSTSSDRGPVIAVTVERCEQLVAIPVSGASKRNVTRNLACNLAPDWSRDNEIVFAKHQFQAPAIAVMQPDGSSQRFVTTAKWAREPRWAPTGRRIVYLDNSLRVHVADLDSGADRGLSRAQFPHWSPDGSEIVGVWNQHLLVQRADGSGERTIATTGIVVGVLGWSVSGTIAFEVTDGYIWSIDADGSNERRLTRGYSGTWSPDGSRLAVYRGVNWPDQVVVVRPDGSEVALLARDAEGIPSWSPDGRFVAFRTHRRLVIADATGNGQTVGPDIGWPVAPEEVPAWSPDGSTIMIASGRDDTDIVGIHAETGSVRSMLRTSSSESSPTFSPDGERILFRKGRESGRLYIARSDGSGRRILVTRNPAQGEAWSPDGSRVAYVWARKLHVTLARHRAGRGEVIAHDVNYGSTSWSPDGRRLVYANSSATGLYTVRPDGSGRRRIVRAPARTLVYSPRWSPLGNRISFSEIENCEGDTCSGPSWITTVSPLGRAKDRLTQGGVAGWAPDGRFLAYTRGELTLFDLARRTSKALSWIPSESIPDWQPTCTQRGTGEGNRLRATGTRSLVCGLGGADHIEGGPSRDRLFGEEGNDRFFAVDGLFDVIGCGAGHDTVVADAGDLVGRDCETVVRR